MPFGLKNVGATYQQTMNIIFQKHLQKTVECYIDDWAIKSKRKKNNLNDL